MPCYRSKDETGHYLPAELYRYIHWIKRKTAFQDQLSSGPELCAGTSDP